MSNPMNTQPDTFDAEDGMFSGWTDEEISAYNAWRDEQDRYADADQFFGGPDFDAEPPF